MDLDPQIELQGRQGLLLEADLLGEATGYDKVQCNM